MIGATPYKNSSLQFFKSESGFSVSSYFWYNRCLNNLTRDYQTSIHVAKWNRCTLFRTIIYWYFSSKFKISWAKYKTCRFQKLILFTMQSVDFQDINFGMNTWLHGHKDSPWGPKNTQVYTRLAKGYSSLTSWHRMGPQIICWEKCQMGMR